MTIDQLLAELEAMLVARRERKMSDCKLVPVDAPAPDVSALVDALEQVIKAAPSSGPLWHGSEQIVEARAALTAHRKGAKM